MDHNLMAEYITEITGQTLLFGLLGKLLYTSPEKEWIRSLLDENVFSEAPIGGDQEDITRGLKLVQDWSSSDWKLDDDVAFADLELDCMRLFIGAGKVLAPPWESVYFSDDRSLFTEQTLQVRNWYRKYGLQIEKLYHEPDDHIGLALSFLAHLAQLALQASEQNDVTEFAKILRDQQAFLTEHPLRWVQTWCDLVDQHARTDFYRGVAFLVNGALKQCDIFLRDAVSNMNDGVESI